jgi:hypothetical protein
VSSQTTRTIEAEDTLTSGQLGFDHPSSRSRWNTSICSWLYDWLSSKPKQQRQLEFVLPSNRGRSGAVPTHRQRVRCSWDASVVPYAMPMGAREASTGTPRTRW